MPSLRRRANRSVTASGRMWLPLAAALAAGALLALTFPPFDLPWPLLLLAVGSWFALTAGVGAREAAMRSLAFAFAFQLVLLRWLTVVGQDAWIALALLEALFFIPVGLIRAIGHNALVSVTLVTAAWPTMDWIRDHAGPVAFGWGQLVFASVVAPWSALAPWLSQEWLTAIIVGIAGAASLVLRGRPAMRICAFGMVVLALALPLLAPATQQPAGSGVQVALVQGGVDRTGLGAFGDRRVVMQRHAALTRATLTDSGVDLIIWPENSVDVDPFDDDEANATVEAVSMAAGAPLLFGALLHDPDGRRNVSVLADGAHLRTVYTKQRLVPFGEVLPAREFISRYIERTKHIPVDFVPGAAPGTLDVAGVGLAIVICFEIADEDGVIAALASGATALLVQTNNATYAGLGQSEQQLRIAQYRAKSMRVPVYVVSTTGPSAVIDATGTIVQIIGEQRVGILTTELPAVRVRS